jgi:hypothetical protein
VVVDDLDTGRGSILPDEAYTPLHINGNAVLADPTAAELVEAVRWRVAEILE